MDYPKNLSEKDRYWLNIIQECRASGKSDYQWLQEHNIPSPTFYYHVKQLRKKACEIPERNQLCTVETQEVVPLIIKDTLFHTSVAGANASSIIYSIVETAKANNLNVYQYLYTLLLYMPGCKDGSEGIEHLMPWSDFIKEHCTGLIDIENITAMEHPTLPIND